MKISRFEEIECWQQARILVKYVYQATAGEAFRKDLRLTGQVQAAAVSAMSNTAEGFTRRSKPPPAKAGGFKSVPWGTKRRLKPTFPLWGDMEITVRLFKVLDGYVLHDNLVGHVAR